MRCSNQRVKRSSSEPRAREGVVSRLGVGARDEVKHDVGREGRNDFKRRFSSNTIVTAAEQEGGHRSDLFRLIGARNQNRPPPSSAPLSSPLTSAPLIKILKIRPVAQRITASLRSNLFSMRPVGQFRFQRMCA